MTTVGRPRGSKSLVSQEDVYAAIVDLVMSNPPRPATRQAVAQELGVEYRFVDEKFDKLLEVGRIRRVQPGVFEPTQVTEDQVVSSTWVPGAPRPVKLEIGDQCISLTLRDVRAILFVLGGFTLQVQRQELRRRQVGQPENPEQGHG